MDAKLQGFGVDVGKRRVTSFARRWADGKTHKEKGLFVKPCGIMYVVSYLVAHKGR